MRVTPVSAFKGNSKLSSQRDGMPMCGSALRELFDVFTSNRGVPIRMKISGPVSRRIDDLRDYYGLDIRSVPDRHHKCLVGEWIGDKYVDYVAEKISG